MQATVARSAAAAVARVRAVDRPLGVLSLAGFISQVGVAVMLPLLPLYARQLGASPLVLGLLTSGFAVMNTIAQLVVGFLSDRFGARRMVPVGLGIYATANALIATASSAVPLVAFRSLAGFGGGMSIVAERVYLARVTPSERMAFTNGVLSAAQSAGTVTGPAVAGLIAAASDLHVPFVLVAVTSVLAFGGTLFLPREPARPTAASDAVADGAADVAPPGVPLAPLAALIVANLALNAGFGGFITTYSPFATTRLAWTTAQVGIVFSLFGLGSILLGPALGRLADRRGRRNVAILGTLPVIAWAPLMYFALPDLVIYAGSVVAGAGLAGFGAAWYALLSEASPAGRQGRYFGFVSAISTLGIIAGALASTALWEAVDLSVGLLVPSVAIALAIPALLTLPRHRANTSPAVAAA
jgi:MFS family permease